MEKIQDFVLMLKPSHSLGETIWTRRRSSKMGVIMQLLGNESSLNNLFMVEVGVMEVGDTQIHFNNELSNNTT